MEAETEECILELFYKPSTSALAGKIEGSSYSWELRSFPPSFKGDEGARKCTIFHCKADLIQCSNNIHPQKNSKRRKCFEMDQMKKKRTEAIIMITQSS